MLPTEARALVARMEHTGLHLASEISKARSRLVPAPYASKEAPVGQARPQPQGSALATTGTTVSASCEGATGISSPTKAARNALGGCEAV